MRHLNVARFLPLNLLLSSPELIADARRAKTLTMVTDVIMNGKLLGTVALASTVSGAILWGRFVDSTGSAIII